MNNLTLNIYKAFGIRKARKHPYSVDLHDFVYNKNENPIEEGGDIRNWSPTPSSTTSRRRVSNARIAMYHAINHIRKTNSPVNIHSPNGGESLLYAHPKTGLLTLRHVTHGDNENSMFDGFKGTSAQAAAKRDSMALNRLQHLHKNSLLTLGDTPMQIDTTDLWDLPSELHTTEEARQANRFMRGTL